ncbi:MAG TPA: SCO family protein [Pyrinomonadaceae bacterium]|jgi:protein SCO1/2|nr:SCO family protein [Pyrinomonadaceae bacterium]
MMMSYRSITLCVLLALAFIVGPVSFSVDAQLKSAHGERTGLSGGEGANFTLTDQDGRPFQLNGLRGRVVLLFFGYTSCPDACPTTLSKLSKVYKLLGPDRDRVVTLFVSVDPGRDTPRVLKDYLKYFRVNSVGLTGTKEEIDRVVNQYGARYEIEKSDSATGYHINHSTDLYLIDQKGEVAQRFKYEGGTKEIAEAVRRLIH